MNYKNLYFDGTLDIADVLTTKGEHVMVGGKEIFWAHTYSDLGGVPEGLDCTPLSSERQLQKAGVEQVEQWTVDYYWNKDDHDTLEAAKAGGQSVAIVVTDCDGGTWTNSGVVAGNYKGGGSVNAMAEGHATFNLSGAWVYAPKA